jgi:hypothetical protein
VKHTYTHTGTQKGKTREEEEKEEEEDNRSQEWCALCVIKVSNTYPCTPSQLKNIFMAR